MHQYLFFHRGLPLLEPTALCWPWLSSAAPQWRMYC